MMPTTYRTYTIVVCAEEDPIEEVLSVCAEGVVFLHGADGVTAAARGLGADPDRWRDEEDL
jgi:hypothetical protein